MSTRSPRASATFYNITDYAERYFPTFAEAPFTSVDSLVLSQFAYIHWKQLVPSPRAGAPAVALRDLLRAEYFGKMFTNMLASDKNKQLLYALSASPRFRNLQVQWHESRRDAQNPEQFSATTFLLPDGTAYLAYRGTDTTFVGWKEDFSMAYVSPVPSQTSALAYLKRVAALLPDTTPLRLGGHSKGGNVAVYAAMMCPEAVRSRILRVYSHDGPGFRPEVIAGSAFSTIQDRIEKTLPQSSTVGMLLQSHEPYRVVQSDQMGGILQHDPFSWAVNGTDFVYREKLTGSAAYGNATLDTWLAQLPDEKRALLIGALFDVMDASGASSFEDFAAHWQTSIPATLKALASLDEETRNTAADIFKALISIAVKGLVPNVPIVSARKEALPDNGEQKQLNV